MASIKQGGWLELKKEIPDKNVGLIGTCPPYEISATNGGGEV